MNVLIACEASGVVRDAFRAKGHDAWSCDLRPAEDASPFHILGDALQAIALRYWNLLIAHPPCTYLSVSGMHWTTRGLRDPQLTSDAIDFAERLWAADVPKIAIENPVGVLSTRSRLGRITQSIQPYEFGEDASKRTCLWLKGLPKLVPTQMVPGRIVEYNGKLVERWSNQTDSGQNRLGPSEGRWKQRSKTYTGVAEAMANQWAQFVETHQPMTP